MWKRQYEVRVQAPPRDERMLMAPEAATLLRLLVAIIFFVSGLAKIWNTSSFRAAVLRHELVPRPLRMLISNMAGPAEAALGLSLLIAPTSALVVFAGTLLVGFSGWSALTLMRQGPLECGCLGGFMRLRHGYFAALANSFIGFALIVLRGEAAHFSAHPASLWMIALLGAAAYWLAIYAESVVRTLQLTLKNGAVS